MYDGEVLRRISAHNQDMAVVVSFSLQNDASLFLREARKTRLTRYIEPNLRLKVIQFEPNDPSWGIEQHSWQLKKIEANWAWNNTIGNDTIRVVFIDTGIDYNHEDLEANYVAGGYDWVNNDNDPMDDNTHSHGTHCAGILAATINNSKGISGLAQVQIMAEKAVDSSGIGEFADLSNAIIHAAENCSADIISMSWGHYFRSNLIYDAVKVAHDAGVLLVAAAGNEDWSGMLYPAAFNEVIAVGATDVGDHRASYSNYGDWVELTAPGGDEDEWPLMMIWSTKRNNNYGSLMGTSQACPHVAGLAALILSQHPDMTRDQLRIHLRKNTNDLGEPGFDQYFGHGRINANKSVSQPPPSHDVLILKWDKPPYADLTPEKLTDFNATILNYGLSGENNIVVQLLVNGTIKDNTTIGFLASGESTTVNLSWNATTEGVHNVTIHVLPVGNEDINDNTVQGNVTTEVGVVRVGPEFYTAIQDAVDAARSGDTIKVPNGTYYETVNIYKNNLKLEGENCEGTQINGVNIGWWGFVAVAVDNVYITRFEIKGYAKCQVNYDPFLRCSGILLEASENSTIITNKIWDNGYGIILTFACKNTLVTDNIIRGNSNGIFLDWTYFEPSNIIRGNYIVYNNNGTVLRRTLNNSIYHNNFINQSFYNLINDTMSSNKWHGRWNVTGNYWSDYTGDDENSGLYQNETGSDSIGDTSYIIDENSQDNYPLMAPINTFIADNWDNATCNIEIISNSTLSNFRFIHIDTAQIDFNAKGKQGTIGFCRIAVPKDLFVDPFTILVG